MPSNKLCTNVAWRTLDEVALDVCVVTVPRDEVIDSDTGRTNDNKHVRLPGDFVTYNLHQTNLVNEPCPAPPSPPQLYSKDSLEIRAHPDASLTGTVHSPS